jgi:hypothetical protein
VCSQQQSNIGVFFHATGKDELVIKDVFNMTTFMLSYKKYCAATTPSEALVVVFSSSWYLGGSEWVFGSRGKFRRKLKDKEDRKERIS